MCIRDRYNLPGTFAPIADYELLESAVNTVREKGLTVRAGNVLTSDVFYNDDPTVNDRWRKMGVLAVEMEAAALYMNADVYKRQQLKVAVMAGKSIRMQSMMH